MVKALAADHGVYMVTNQLAKPAYGDQDNPYDVDKDTTLIDDDEEEDEGEELDDEGDDEIKYVKTTQCEFPLQRNRSSQLASSSAPPATATDFGLSSFSHSSSQASQSTSQSRAPTSTTMRGRGGKSTKATKKSSKKFEPTLTPKEELATARQKEENKKCSSYHISQQ